MGANKILYWSPAMSVGNQLIDNQHRMLLELINRVNEGVAWRASTQTFMQEAYMQVEFMKVHATTEEFLMARAGFAGLEEHKALHRKLNVRLFELLEGLESESHPELSYGRISNFFLDWLTIHVMGEDRNYISALAKLPQKDYIALEHSGINTIPLNWDEINFEAEH